MREVKKIILHCSDSDYGTASLIRKWHTKERGWSDIGYHYVITNGVQESCRPYKPEDDGVIQDGRPLEIQGAHVKGHNSDSIGICLIGTHHFTAKQLYDALPTLLQILLATYELTYADVYGHNEFDPHKTCPNFNVNTLRNLFKESINVKSS
jgi:N-acetylmuramoyl-L-alanine amidase